jgi:hypothetical protein
MSGHPWNADAVRNSTSLLTPHQRDEIGKRRYTGDKSRDLALEYGVSRAVIDRISKIEN